MFFFELLQDKHICLYGDEGGVCEITFRYYVTIGTVPKGMLLKDVIFIADVISVLLRTKR